MLTLHPIDQAPTSYDEIDFKEYSEKITINVLIPLAVNHSDSTK